MDLITDLTPAAVDARLRYANALSKATIIPDVYRGQPANVLVAIETGTALGIPPTQALQSLISIKGRVTMSAGRVP